MGSTIIEAYPLSILRAKSWKVIMKFKIVFFLLDPLSQNAHILGRDNLSRLIFTKSTEHFW